MANLKAGDGSGAEDFIPALIVVDMQEDFCPPNGSLAVQDGRSIAPLINNLLSMPKFAVRVATLDWHPADHISFANNHPAPNNKPFESIIQMKNPIPERESETRSQLLWPIHCVADSPGAAIIPEIESDRLDLLVQKGRYSHTEMYSAFKDAFGNAPLVTSPTAADIDLAESLGDQKVTDVFVVGLAGDYCVKHTAIDAVKAGFRCWLIEEGTKCVDPTGWEKAKLELRAAGVSVIHADDAVMKKLVVD